MTFKQINTLMKEIKETKKYFDNTNSVNEVNSYVIDGFKIKYEKGEKGNHWFNMWKLNDEQFLYVVH